MEEAIDAVKHPGLRCDRADAPPSDRRRHAQQHGYLERCLGAVANRGDEIVVVYNTSEDVSQELVRRRFPTELHCGAVSAAEGEH